MWNEPRGGVGDTNPQIRTSRHKRSEVYGADRRSRRSPLLAKSPRLCIMVDEWADALSDEPWSALALRFIRFAGRILFWRYSLRLRADRDAGMVSILILPLIS